jgi:hypothetical protein
MEREKEKSEYLIFLNKDEEKIDAAFFSQGYWVSPLYGTVTTTSIH